MGLRKRKYTSNEKRADVEEGAAVVVDDVTGDVTVTQLRIRLAAKVQTIGQPHQVQRKRTLFSIGPTGVYF